MSNDATADQIVQQAREWWTTEIIDIHPGQIAVRGYEIQDLIGNVTFPEMIWLMLRGDLPTRPQSRLFEAALVAAVDHGPQAPSISVSRMAVTCGLPVNGAMASAINVLDDIHGGAGEQCMELYREIAREVWPAEAPEVLEVTDGIPDAADGTAANGVPDTADEATLRRAADTVIARWKENGVKYLPGFGHRFHPLDPRAPRLLGLVDDAVANGVVSGRYAAIGKAVVASIGEGRAKPIPMNIDGATAVIYSELGFEPTLGRGIFILSRSVGILAHAWEQMQQGGRIKGPMPKTIPYTYAGHGHREVPVMDDAQRSTTA